MYLTLYSSTLAMADRGPVALFVARSPTVLYAPRFQVYMCVGMMPGAGVPAASAESLQFVLQAGPQQHSPG